MGRQVLSLSKERRYFQNSKGINERKRKMGLEEDFQTAVDQVSNKINKTLSNEELLEVYALFKQASIGDCNTSRPGMMDFKGKAKWDAWNGKKGLGQDEAKQKYIELANQLKDKLLSVERRKYRY